MAEIEEEWGPWILHDGKGCPLPSGTIVEVHYEDAFGYRSRTVTTVFGGSYSSWNWELFPELKRILSYREKKPKGIQILGGVLADIEEKTPAEPVKMPEKTRA